MSEHGDDLDRQRENFKMYLHKFGVVESLTNVLANLYELEIKPTDPLDYIRTHMTERVHEKEELKILRAKHDQMVIQVQEIEEENLKLAKEINQLEYYEDYLSKSELC